MASTTVNKPLTASYIASTGAQVSLANGVSTKAESLAVEAGIYLVIMSAQFDKNATGIRSIGNNSAVPSGQRNGVVTVNNVGSGQYATVKCSFIANTPGTTFDCYCYQNSGSALDVWTKIEAIRLN